MKRFSSIRTGGDCFGTQQWYCRRCGSYSFRSRRDVGHMFDCKYELQEPKTKMKFSSIIIDGNTFALENWFCDHCGNWSSINRSSIRHDILCRYQRSKPKVKHVYSASGK